ncbi:hypothetical protein F2Q69_00042933 [Brassica cretica]|uniref:Uncharacterized protein n=1 Tax=Brassica cretica TaxID=69181 RepID=A0A8S9NME2_BRACR|nr:hypothetical protein F2Q69_00042933 [Brassica cretica]
MHVLSNKYLDLQASMNQALMVFATKSCSLLFNLYPRIHVNRTLMIAATKSDPLQPRDGMIEEILKKYPLELALVRAEAEQSVDNID